jgi:HlyD family secretion protein
MGCRQTKLWTLATAGPGRRSRSTRVGGAGLTALVSLTVVTLLIGAATLWWRTGSTAGTAADELVDTVRRGDFRLEITESGEIESSGNTDVRCEVKSNNTAGTAILRIVPEGTQVKPGDFLVELDSSALEKDRIQQQIVVNTSEAILIEARSAHETAVLAKEEYVDGTFKQETEVIESEIFVAEENLRRAQEFLRYSEKLMAKGYITELQLEADQFAVEKAQKELEAARTKLDVLARFTKAKMIKQLESDIVSNRAKWKAEESSYQLEVSKLKEIEEQIANCTILAPSEGQVTYAHKESWRDEVVIEEGILVRERQVIVRLPDPRNMQVKIEINESVVERVKPGMRAAVRPVGRDDVTLPGTVIRVNEYSEPTSRWEGNIKNYSAFIRLDATDSSLRTGMTAEVTIHCQDIPDILKVPVQAVYAHGPELTYCFVLTPNGWEQREVQVGPTNDSDVIIEKGLAENDKVSLNPRAHVDEAILPQLSAQELQQAVRRGPRLDAKTAKETVAEKTDEKTKEKADAQADAKTDAKTDAQADAKTGEQAAEKADEHLAEQSEAGATPADVTEVFRQLDKNADDALSTDELPVTLRPHFEAADTSRNGTLDRGEVAAAMRKLSGVSGTATAASGGGG